MSEVYRTSVEGGPVKEIVDEEIAVHGNVVSRLNG
jgi:hypothetical protein